MKKLFTKVVLSIMIGMMVVSTFAISKPVEATESGISPLTYNEYNFSFTGSRNIAQICTGTFLSLTVNCTSTGGSNETIELKVYIQYNNSTKTYTFKTDGKDHKFSGIYMGLGGGNKSVVCTLTNISSGTSNVSGKIIFSS
ncbi:MAG: hypothetical protein HFJ54_04525 [Clostridia bacterium]|nr:hypothetical protein [Clostridia bacterium]